MKNDESYGVIPLRKEHHIWEILVIKQAAGHWGFPKGHKDPGELNLDAARRELLEETGLHVKDFLSLDAFMENYQFDYHGEKIDKYVWYYPALVEGEVMLDQPREVVEAKWVLLSEAAKVLTYPRAREITSELSDLIKEF